LCSLKQDGTFVISKVTDNFVKQKVSAGEIVSKITKALGGNGGGRPQFAQGMGKTQNKIDDILLEIEKELVKGI